VFPYLLCPGGKSTRNARGLNLRQDCSLLSQCPPG
jgi:hypothetical protein